MQCLWSEKIYRIRCFDALLSIKTVCTFSPSETMWMFHSKSKLLFGWQSSWISLALLFLQLHSQRLLRPVYGFLCLLCICFYGILHLFFSHMPILKYPTKHVPTTCVFVFGGDMHPCSCGSWFFFFRKLNYFLQWFWRALSMTISCNMFYLTAILWIADHLNKLNPAWKTY